MTKYEAETKKQYASSSGLITARQKIAIAVNCTWLYSMHWKNSTWLGQANTDIKSRLADLNKKRNELISALKY